MNRRSPSIAKTPNSTLALCVSLIAHGLGLSGMAWWYIHSTPDPKWPAIDKYAVWLHQSESQQPPIKPEVKPETSPPVVPPPSIIPPKPAPKKPEPKKKAEAKKFEKPAENHKDDSGEADGHGTANRSTPGDKPMQATAAGREQADLMKQADKFDDSAFLPASAGELQGEDAMKQTSPKLGTYVPDSMAKAVPMVNPDNRTPMLPTTVSKAVTEAPAPQKPGPALASATPVSSGTNKPVQNAPLSQQPTPKPRLKEIRGHRATLSDTESVAFMATHNLPFHAGKLDGRKGLKVITTIPRLGLASEADMDRLGGVHAVFGVQVDPDGNVQDVQVLNSSGSENIDRDCKTAIFNHWILEPQKDKNGNATDLTWVITFE